MVEAGTMSSIFYNFETKESLVSELSLRIAKALEKSIREKDKASFLVSGGSTPKALFEKLSNIEIQWDKVTIALVDERWVDSNHQDSNELLVKTNLLKNFASKANFVGMYFDETDEEKAQEECSKIYLEKVYPFDVIVLGMGGDAHTASLFPENEKLDEAFDMNNKNLCISIKPTTASHSRMSLTLQGILNAKTIILHIEGEEKLKVYKEAISLDDKYKMPIASVLNQDMKDIEVYYA
ncbi:MAG: 6-phosphogluconolactonase [Arcobacter sp.]|nr:MAG: 6-phosphogluconolactonase [Arcobacter sp.]